VYCIGMRNEQQKLERRIDNERAKKEYEKYYIENSHKEYVCKDCNKSKLLSEFVKSYNFKNRCKKCHSQKVKNWRKANFSIASSISKKSFRNSADFIMSFKIGKPCGICNGKFPPCVLDFHHRDLENKLHNVSQLYQKSRSRIVEEIQKCILICANCHRQETQNNEHKVPVHKNRRMGNPINEKPLNFGDIGKECKVCRIVKHEDNFTLLKKGVRHSYCKSCLRQKNLEYNRKNPGRRSPSSSLLIELKNSSNCMECGKSYPHYIMDFDHVKGEKRYNLSQIRNHSLQTVKREIEKCDIVCVNCHRVRTYNRKVNSKNLNCPESSEICRRVQELIRTIGYEVNISHRMSEMVFDLYVPAKSLLIKFGRFDECCQKENRKNNAEMWKLCKRNGSELLYFFEDEWIESFDKISNLIKNRINANKPIGLRPSQCSIRQVERIEADYLYDRFHYIGKCLPKISFGAYFEEKLIACMSFKRPTRQSSHDWELVRMVVDNKFRIHGIWNKLIRAFIDSQNPTSIVSFSDNRLFNGNVYEKIGFKFDGVIPPDYYWVKGKERFHKSRFRKHGPEKTSGMTEYQLREAEGFSRIWDLGKKRWVWRHS